MTGDMPSATAEILSNRNRLSRSFERAEDVGVVEEREPLSLQVHLSHSGSGEQESPTSSSSLPQSRTEQSDSNLNQQTRFCFYQPVDKSSSHLLPTPRNLEQIRRTNLNQHDTPEANEIERGVENAATVPSDAAGTATATATATGPMHTSGSDTSRASSSRDGGYEIVKLPTDPSSVSKFDPQAQFDSDSAVATDCVSASANIVQGSRIGTGRSRIRSKPTSGVGVVGGNTNNSVKRFNFYSASSPSSRPKNEESLSQHHEDRSGVERTRIGERTAIDQVNVLQVEAELVVDSGLGSKSKAKTNAKGQPTKNSILVVPELTPSEDSTDEILKSLRETEEHRALEFRLGCGSTPVEDSATKHGGRYQVMRTSTSNKIIQKKKNRSSSIPGDSHVSSSSSDFPSSSHSAPISHQTEAATHSLQGAGDVLNQSHLVPCDHDLSTRQSIEEKSNPYEDAIKEALDLLRRHRTPPESRPSQLQTTINLDEISAITPSATSDVHNRAANSFKLQTPREMDRLLYLRGDQSDEESTEFHDIGEQTALGVSTSASTEDRKVRVKERQMRMASYASRLQEYKSSMETSDEPWRHRAAGFSAGPVNQIRTCDESVGVSDLSLSTKANDEEVQRGVERVLLAILERASTSRSRASMDHVESLASQIPDRGDDEGASGRDTPDALVRAMDTILRQPSTTDAIGSFSDLLHRHHSPRIESGRSDLGPSSPSKKFTERSVVDDLLIDGDAPNVAGEHIQVSTTTKAQRSPIYHEEKKSSEAVQVTTSFALQTDEDGIGIEAQESLPASNYSDLIDSCLRSSSLGPSSKGTGADDDSGGSADIENDVDGSSNESDRVQRSFEDELPDTDDDNSDPYTRPGYGDDNSNDGTDDGLERVLGPLSQKAGGTTGVVLDLTTDIDEQGLSDNPTLIGSFSTVIKDAESIISYVTSAISPERPKEKVQSRDEPNSFSQLAIGGNDEDPEATELMRTLCAHLLPFGVDQSIKLLDTIPAWDEDNVNEAGYRIIRLTKSQLRRVENAFESMVNGLKRDSERHLKELDHSNSGYEGYDANFVRELQEAEKLLDDEELRMISAATTKNSVQRGAARDFPVTSRPGKKNQAHPQFPGLKSSGMGDMGDLEYFHLPIIYKSNVTGFEPTKDLILEPGNVVAGQYLVESELGSAAFSTAYRCVDLSSDEDSEDGQEEVCLKVIKNTKDFFDQSLDEIKVLELLRQTGQCNENNIVEMKTFFYHREHLVIVTELLRQNLFEFGKFIVDNDEEAYFTIPRLAYVTRQALIALNFVHGLSLVHSDIKPENILLSSYSRARVKLIDFGSSCYLTDRQSSYIQSRSYRAPEVVLGLPYDGKIDIWSLGCVVAEMFTNEVTFQNDSIVSMLSRIEAICGPFPRHMIARGRQSSQFFTKSGLLYEIVAESDDEDKAQHRFDDESETDSGPGTHFDVFQPKSTCLSARLGFSENLMNNYCAPRNCDFHRVTELEEQAMFADFVGNLLTIDPDGRPSAAEALNHPWMKYAESLTEDDIRYPSS